MKKNKLLIFLLIFALVASLTLAACGEGDEDEAKDDGTTEDENKQDDVADGEQDEADEGTEEFTTDTENISEDILDEEQVLRVNLGEEPPCLDPQLNTDSTSGTIINDMLEGLIRLDHTGTVKEDSGIAVDWKISEDGKEYTFNLREAQWSDGEPVTAGDFEFAWRRAVDPKLASDYAVMLYNIKNAEEYFKGEITDPEQIGVKAVDDKTLKVTLDKPDPAFLSKLQHYTFFPSRKDLVEQYGDKYASEPDYMAYNGPFYISDWRHGSKVVLSKNDKYWDSQSVLLDKVEFSIVKESNTAVGMYETGELDYIGVPSQFIDKYKDEIKLLTGGSCYYRFINVDSEYGNSPSFRKALRMAVDEQKISKALSKGMSPVAYAWVPPGIPGYGGETFREIAGEKLFETVATGATEEDLEALMDAAAEELGVSKEDLRSHQFKYLTGQGDYYVKHSQVYQQMWTDNLGINIKVDQATWKVRLDQMSKGDFELTASGWGGDYNDPMTFMDLFETGNNNNDTRWNSAEYDKLIQKAKNTTDAKERIDAMVEAEKILISDEMAIQPYSYRASRLLQRPYVKNIVRLPLQVTSGKKWAYILEH
ncbi:peptide ABC transporter substrate-binding protein [Dethiothermospora halolimnae]|uniref:peptide ABC transporter substrate-binding protein n=1 Tax=Dethiothermospora halolimnae TaxID=3114390 RepID=UPI003CCBE280